MRYLRIPKEVDRDVKMAVLDREIELRDRFAEAALRAAGMDILVVAPEEAARRCYDLADAMIAERRKRGKSC